MTIILILSMVFFFITIRKKTEDTFLSISQTRAINGIMTVLIFISHFTQYIAVEKTGEIYSVFQSKMGQLVVVPFLAFSGYGIMISILKKKKPYVKTIMKKRFLNIWVKFALIILIFLAVNLIMGIEYSISDTLLAFTGFTSVGNSNWYIMAILIMYFITYISFIGLPPEKYNIGIAIVLVLSGVYVVLMFLAGKGSWYYDTIISFTVGMLVAFYREKIVLCLNNKRLFIVIAAVSVTGFAALLLFNGNIIVFQAYEILFIALMIIFSHKLEFKSKILEWLGEYAFEFFLLGRIPFIILKDAGLNLYVYFFISLIITIIISYGFRKAFDFSSKVISNNK